MMRGEANTPVWEWRFPEIEGARAKEWGHRLVTLGLGAVLAIWVAAGLVGAPGDIRFLAVVSFMLVALGVLGVRDSQRARSTSVSVDHHGILRVADRAATAMVDLRDATEVAVRRRNHSTSWRWAIEVVTPAGGWHAEVRPIATIWNQPEAVMAALETELSDQLSRLDRTVPSAPVASPQDSASSPHEPTSASVSPGRSGGGASVERFEWRPPRAPHAQRNRRRVRAGFGAAALAVAILAAVSEWDSGVVAVLASMFVPVLLGVIGFGFDCGYRIGTRFGVSLDSESLVIDRWLRSPSVIPRSEIETVAIDLRREVSGSDADGSKWFLIVYRIDGDTRPIPLGLGFGSRFTRNDAIALEAELRNRLVPLGDRSR
jgi:hypothetical protein